MQPVMPSVRTQRSSSRAAAAAIGEMQRRVGEQTPARNSAIDCAIASFSARTHDLPVRSRQLLAVDVEPRPDQLLLHALLVEPCQTLREVEHDARRRAQRLAAGKGDDVAAVVRS